MLESVKKGCIKNIEISIKRSVGYYQTDQHIYCGSLRRVRKREDRIFEEIMGGNSQNLVKDTNVNIQETQKTPR